MTETPQTSYDKWRRHFNNMIEGRLVSANKIVTLKERPQVGKGLEVVSPVAQTLEMAKAAVQAPRRKGIKRKSPSCPPQSKPKRRRRSKAKPKKKKKSNKKPRKKQRRSRKC